MALVLWSHPFSSYCQKVIVALYESGLPFEARLVDFGDPASTSAFRAVWPIAKMPVLVDSEHGVTLPEATIAIEYLHRLKPEVGLLPRDAQAELKTRLLDRIFDNYVETPLQKIVGDRLRPQGQEDAHGVSEAHDQLRITYGVLERELADGRRWAIGDAFTLADCSAAPALFYADLVEPFRHDWPKLAAYFDRLTKRPSFARAVHEAAPFMPHFPKLR